MKILNLYSGIGGNRKLWENVDVTAVEIDPEIAAIYKDFFPQDNVIVGDAHQYLLDHYKEFDFIWSSPECKTHSRMNKNFSLVRYADMTLWQEIIFLRSWFDGKFCVENVIPYYEVLIPAQQIDRHLYWCNFRIRESSKKNPPKEIASIIAQKTRSTKRKRTNYDGAIINIKIANGYFDISKYKLTKARKNQILRNCVKPETGFHILNRAKGVLRSENISQLDLAI